MELFDANGIIVNSIPAYTSGKTQPFAVVFFRVYNARLNEIQYLTVSTHVIYEYSCCAMMWRVYEEAFKLDNIKDLSVGAASGHSTNVQCSLLYFPCPRTADDLNTVIGVIEFQSIYEEKRRAVRQSILGADARIEPTAKSTPATVWC